MRTPCRVVPTSSSEATTSVLHRVRKHPASCQIFKRSDVQLVAALFVMSETSCHWQQLSSQPRAPPFIIPWLFPNLAHRCRRRPCFPAPSLPLGRGHAALQQRIDPNVCRHHRHPSFPSCADCVLVLGSKATRCFRRNACEGRHQWTYRTNAACCRRSLSKHTDAIRHGEDAKASVWMCNARRRWTCSSKANSQG